ncbi:MAG: hypothetical protein KF729_17985 [Sandaracinaceae bacterium]|nr:hypothetical protein [Sandaracinaceae bacterium]
MAVDGDAIVRAVGTLPLVGNEEGLIPAFGLYLTRHFATFYNRTSFALLHAAEARSPEAAAVARASLVEAGHVCAFNTFGGIMLSQEWEAVVMPMVESTEDWVHGIVGVVNALGWGRWRVEALRGGEELTVSIANSYESEGYLADYPRRDSGGVCFLATGGVAGIMNLVYHGDIAARPALDDAFYQQLFHAPGRFNAREVACRAAGADRCEVVARRVAG